ncbi:MAG: hypothetical protein KC486_21000 [Myxococcales bacterium]|nr:hypothetical protein [Myxococcales bacterium]
MDRTNPLSALHHPLLGVACPTVGDLLDRAGLEARRTLETAARLAARRCAQQDQALALREEVGAAPSSESLAPWAMPPWALTPSDVARALLAELPRVVMDALFVEISDDAAELLGQDRDRWRRSAEDSPPEVDRDLPLARAYARRWALTLGRDSARPLAALQLLGHGASAALATYSSRYLDGLITLREAEFEVQRNLAAAAERERWCSAEIDPALDEPYYDYFDGIAAVEAALERGPGAVVVGERGSGRRALLRECQRRHRRGAGPPAIRGFGFTIDYARGFPFFAADCTLVPPPEVDDPCIFAFVDPGITILLGDNPDPELAQAWLAMCLRRSGGGDDPRLILALTPAQHRQLRRILPELARLEVIAIPEPAPIDEFVMSMCKVFELETIAAGPVDLARLLWWRARLPSAAQTLHALAQPAPRHFQRLLRRALSRGDAALPSRIQGHLTRLGLTEGDLEHLRAIEAALFDPPTNS